MRRICRALLRGLAWRDPRRFLDACRFDFESKISRTGTHAVKTDVALLTAKYGPGGADALPMWVADMDLPVAPAIVQAIRKRAAHPLYGYTLQPPSMWAHVQEWLRVRHRWPVSADALVFASSTVGAAANCVRAFTKSGEAVVVLTPLYPPLRHLVTAEGRVLVELRLSPRAADGQWELDVPALRLELEPAHVTMLILCNPHNPSGRVWTPAELDSLVAAAAETGVTIVADEIHADLTMPPHQFTPCARVAAERRAVGKPSARVLTLCSPSKAFNLAGLGSTFVVTPGAAERAAYVRECDHAHGTFGGVFQTEALQASYAHGGAWLDAALRQIASNIEQLQRTLKASAPELLAVSPDAGYLVWINCSALGLSAAQLESWWVHEAKVLPSLGLEFADDREAEQFVRLNVAVPPATLHLALSRIVGALVRLRASPPNATAAPVRKVVAFAPTLPSGREVAAAAAAAPDAADKMAPPGPEAQAKQAKPVEQEEAQVPTLKAEEEAEETRTTFKRFQGALFARFSGELNGATVELEGLRECTVLLLDWTSQVTIDKCVGCTFVLGPVSGSVFLRDSSGCTLSAPCRQLRTRGCEACDLFVHTLGPVVETSAGIRFERYNVSYPGQAAHFKRAGLDVAKNNWAEVYDFNKGDISIGAGKEHWSLLPPAAFARLEVQFEAGMLGTSRLNAGAPENATLALLPADHAAAPARVLTVEPPVQSKFAERQPIGKRLIEGKWELIYDEEEMTAKPS